MPRCGWMMAALFVGAIACGDADEPIGEPILRSFGGGLCSPECTQIQLRHDDDRLQFIDYDDGYHYATWTDAGLAEYELASAEAAEQGPQTAGCDDELPVYELTFVHEDDTWSASYCTGVPTPDFLVRGDALARALMDSMQGCVASEWAEPDC